MSQARPGEELIHKIISHFRHGAALYRYLSFILKHRPPPLVCRAFWWTSGACPAFLQRIRLNVRYRARSIFHKTRSALAKTAPPPTEFPRNVREIRPVTAPVFLYYEREQRCTRQDAAFFIGQTIASYVLRRDYPTRDDSPCIIRSKIGNLEHGISCSFSKTSCNLEFYIEWIDFS